MSDHIIAALRSGHAAEALALAEAQLAGAASAEGHYWKALALQSLGQTDAALASMDTAIDLAPERTDFPMTRSVMLLGRHDLAQAQSGLMDALALNPNALEAYVGLVHIALGQNNLAEATRLLRLAERVNDEDLDVLLAKGALRQAEGDFDSALALYTQVSEQRPDSVLVLSSLAAVYLKKGLPVFAVQALTRACTLAPAQPGLWRALVQAHLAQQDPQNAASALDQLLALLPEDRDALMLRLQWREAQQDFDGALADADVLYRLLPSDIGVMACLCRVQAQRGEGDAARTRLAKALAADVGNEALWQLCASFEGAMGADAGPVIADWLASFPESATAHEAMAVYAESKGDLAAAAQSADRALGLSDALPMAQFVKLRQEVREYPEAALDRLVLLAQRAQSVEAQRMVLGWIGLASDRLQRYGDAAEAFTRMAQITLPHKTLPTPYPAVDVPETGAQGRLLWAPVGARIEPVFTALSPVLGACLLVDRNQPSVAREDGFGAFRAKPGSADAGSAFSWRTGVQALGLQTDAVIDWLPQWDAYTAAALAGTELTVLIIDPRDALLNWMVFGSAQAYVFLPKLERSAMWLAATYHAVADTRDTGPQRVHVIGIDALEMQAEPIAVQLQSALGLAQTPDASKLAAPVLALGGMPNRFPAGHWRHYREAFAEAFAVLTPAALRFGYPQD